LRAGIIDKIIFGIGFNLKQTLKTIHLAVKIFDIVSLANPNIDVNDPKNHPKNLKVLAAQCLLLASKFNEVTRLYPAEIVH